MKKLLLATILMMGLSSTYSCQRETDEPESSSVNSSSTQQFLKDKDKILSFGYDVSEMSDQGKFYLVEGDIAISKSLLAEADTITRHTYYGDNNKIKIESNGTKRTIKVAGVGDINKIAKSGGQNCTEKSWEDAFKDAIKEWNSLQNFGIELKWDSSVWDIAIHGVTTGINGFAYAYTPRNGNPGDIQIKVDYTGAYGKISYTRQVQAAVHLLGHAMGFSHTNPASSNSQEHLDEELLTAPKIIPEAHDDKNSVMEMKSVLKEFAGFTAGDRIAFSELYPLKKESGNSNGGNYNFYFQVWPDPPHLVGDTVTFILYNIDGRQVYMEQGDFSYSFSAFKNLKYEYYPAYFTAQILTSGLHTVSVKNSPEYIPSTSIFAFPRDCSVEFTANEVNIAGKLLVRFSNTSLHMNHVINYEWDVPDNINIITNPGFESVYISAKELGTYTVKVRELHQYDNINYLTDWVEHSIKFVPDPGSIPNPGSDPVISGPSSFRDGEWGNYTIEWNVPNASEYYTYTWSKTAWLDLYADGMRATAISYWPDNYSIHVRIEGKYNDYRKSITKEVDVIGYDHGNARLAIFICNDAKEQIRVAVGNDSFLLEPGQHVQTSRHFTSLGYKLIKIEYMRGNLYEYFMPSFYGTLGGGVLAMDCDENGIYNMGYTSEYEGWENDWYWNRGEPYPWKEM